MSRVAVIALDAAQWDLVETLMDEGKMPNLAKMRQEAVSCLLRHDSPYQLDRVWEAFSTGRFVPTSSTILDPETYATIQVGARREPPFFFGTGKTVLTLDVPNTTLAYPVEGAQIIGWGTHTSGYPRASRPAGLLNEIEARFGPYPAELRQHMARWQDPRSISAMTDAMVRGSRLRVDVVRWLLSRVPDWDLFITLMPESHGAGENLWYGVDEGHPLHGWAASDAAGAALARVYGGIDDAVGRLLPTFDDDTYVVVTALHGMEPNTYDLPTQVLFPELMYRLQFGRPHLRQPHASGSNWAPVIPRSFDWWIAYMERRLPGFPFGFIRRRLPELMPYARRRVGAALGRVQSSIETTQTPEEIGEPRAPMEYQIACRYRRFWPQMRAFALPAYNHSRIRVNLRGRERNGIVAVDDYKAVLDEIEADLRACRNPRTGNSVVEDILRPRVDDPLSREDVEDDLAIILKDCPDAIDHPRAGRIGPFPFHRTGGHSGRGFAFISGPGLSPGFIGERPFWDLMPTVLSLLGASPPSETMGQSFLATVR